jgi:hypothetical protein
MKKRPIRYLILVTVLLKFINELRDFLQNL